MRKFYIVPKESKVGQDYLKYQDKLNNITNLFRKFAKENNIHTNTFHPTGIRLWIHPDVEDLIKFENQFIRNKNGQFKKNTLLGKKWVTLCKENDLHENIQKPYLPFYFKNVFGSCKWRLFNVDDQILATFASDSDFICCDNLKEVKGSEFYSFLESHNIVLD